MRVCWCGSGDLLAFSQEYSVCSVCGTLVSQQSLTDDQLRVQNDDTDFYGKQYWLDHQKQDLGFPDIHTRARNDLTERNLHWLKTLLKYRLPPAKVLEPGCSHGSFVALLQLAGYDASGVEMSPWVVEFGQKTFDVPISVGPVEVLDIAPGSLDVIALMDVLEHLPDPSATMAHCLKLLKPDGLLLIQTPQFKDGMDYTALVETEGAFLEQLKADEHLYLFSDQSVTRLFQQLGAEYIQFEPAIFGHYDMFFAVSRMPLETNSIEGIEASLTATPRGRMALALLDIYERDNREFETLAQLRADKAYLIDKLQSSEANRPEMFEAQGQLPGRITELEADKDHLVAQLQTCEADRTARLEVIEAQGQQLGRILQLEADKDHLVAQLQTCEADRAARLEVIEAQAQQLGRILQLEAEKDRLVARLQACEADRAARLEMFEARDQLLGRISELEVVKDQLVAQLQACEADRADLYANKWVTIGLKAGLIPGKRK